MRRAIISLAVFLSALIGVGIATGQAGYSPSSVTNVQGAGTPYKLIGYAGKIIAVKPPGDWLQGSGTADTGSAPAPQLPLTLPVSGTDVHIAGSNETFMAS